METKWLEFAADVAKQVITLAVGIVTLTMTFAEKLSGRSGQGIYIPWTLKAGWIALSLATLFAVWTLMAITGTAQVMATKGTSKKVDKPSPHSNVDIPARSMILLFALGLMLVFFTGFHNWL